MFVTRKIVYKDFEQRDELINQLYYDGLEYISTINVSSAELVTETITVFLWPGQEKIRESQRQESTSGQENTVA